MGGGWILEVGKIYCGWNFNFSLFVFIIGIQFQISTIPKEHTITTLAILFRRPILYIDPWIIVHPRKNSLSTKHDTDTIICKFSRLNIMLMNLMVKTKWCFKISGRNDLSQDYETATLQILRILQVKNSQDNAQEWKETKTLNTKDTFLQAYQFKKRIIIKMNTIS